MQKSDPRIQANVEALPNRVSIGIGDYIGIQAFRGKGHAMWADTRNGKQEIFFGQIPFEEIGGGGDTPPPNDSCQNARELGNAFPFGDFLDVSSATSASDDPVSCSGGRDTHSVWYRYTPGNNTVIGVETVLSSFDTVLSVYTGSCGSLTRLACNDDFGPAVGPPTRSMVTFAATAGTTYLIEVSGKGSAGRLQLGFGAPMITDVRFTNGPAGKSLKITGAGFPEGSSKVFIRKLDDLGNEIELTTVTPTGERQSDGTYTMLFATKKKLKKLVKPGNTIIVTVRATVGGVVNVSSIVFGYTR